MRKYMCDGHSSFDCGVCDEMSYAETRCDHVIQLKDEMFAPLVIRGNLT